MRWRARVRVRALLLLGAVVLLSGGVALWTMVLKVTPTAQAGRAAGALSDVINGVLPSVVNITAETGVGRAMPTQPRLCSTVPPPVASEMPRLRDGSGFIIDPSGFILTNRHVVEGADEVTVTLQDNSALQAQVMGVSPCDLALLKIDAGRPLKALEFGDSNALRIGEPVVAVGNPLGLGTSVSVGVVSALHRDIRVGPVDNFIQTDAAINHGNSGGPLLNMKGKVIGVNTAIVSPTNTSIGLGFAFPSNDAKFIAYQLRQDGRVHIGWIGTMVQRVTPEIAQAVGLSRASGAMVTTIDDDAPPEDRQLQPADIITSYDGKDVPDQRAFTLMVGETPIGRKTSVVVWRNGAQQTIPVTVAEWVEKGASSQPTSRVAAATTRIEPPNFGWKLENVTEEERTKYNLAPNLAGAFVAEVTPGSAAAESELAPGDVIINVQRQPITTPDQVKAELDDLRKQNHPYALLLVQGSAGLRWTALRLFPLAL
jgi:serine protease Do